MTSEKFKEFVNCGDYDINEILDTLVEDVEELRSDKLNGKRMSLDEVCLVWGDLEIDYIMDLKEYTHLIFKKSMELAYNVISSFELEEEE